jgi:hypothetical protein
MLAGCDEDNILTNESGSAGEIAADAGIGAGTENSDEDTTADTVSGGGGTGIGSEDGDEAAKDRDGNPGSAIDPSLPPGNPSDSPPNNPPNNPPGNPPGNSPGNPPGNSPGTQSPGQPGPSNTGVPSGKKLTVHEGDLKITKDNTVIDSMEIRGLVRIEAKNVTIKNCLITGRYLSSPLSLVYVNGPNYSVTIQDSEIYAKYPSSYVDGIIGKNFTLERVNIHSVIDQVKIIGDNVLIKDSWIHNNLHYLKDPNHNNTPSHDDNIQIQVGRNIRIIHNTMTSTHNAAIMVTQDMGVVGDVLIERNFISDGASGFNLAQKSHGTLKGFVIKDNTFTRTQKYAGCAIIVDAPSRPLLSLSGNVWSDGTPISIVTR